MEHGTMEHFKCALQSIATDRKLHIVKVILSSSYTFGPHIQLSIYPLLVEPPCNPVRYNLERKGKERWWYFLDLAAFYCSGTYFNSAVMQLRVPWECQNQNHKNALQLCNKLLSWKYYWVSVTSCSCCIIPVYLPGPIWYRRRKLSVACWHKIDSDIRQFSQNSNVIDGLQSIKFNLRTGNIRPLCKQTEDRGWLVLRLRLQRRRYFIH